jgi:hypothetical protein
MFIDLYSNIEEPYKKSVLIISMYLSKDCTVSKYAGNHMNTAGELKVNVKDTNLDIF